MNKLIILLFLLFAYSEVSADEPDIKNKDIKSITFEKKTVEAFQSIPILSEGRVKPLNTYAAFLLLRINGKRVVRDESGKKIEPMDWFLTVLFYPDVAMHQKIFLVDNSEVLESFGFENAKPRDRYSFKDLGPFLEKIMKAASEIDAKEAKARTPLEQQTLRLAMNLVEFLNVAKTLDFARPMDEKSALGIELNKPSRHIIAEMLQIQKRFTDSKEVKELPEEKQKIFKDEIDRISMMALEKVHQADWMTIFPPADPKEKVWRNPYDLFLQNKVDTNSFDASAILTALEETCMAISSQKETPESFSQLANVLQKNIYLYSDRFSLNLKIQESLIDNLGSIIYFVVSILITLFGIGFFLKNKLKIPFAKISWRPQYYLYSLIPIVNIIFAGIADYIGKIKTENLYYKLDFIFNSLILFIVAFLSISFSFMKLNSKKWNTINMIFLVIPITLLTVAITKRCIILDRPPVATLYETILFITAIICLVCLGVELMFKNRIALFATSIVGTGGLFLSYAYESGDGTDTMGNLAAVLNSNFWLSTHVTAVTIGYSAGLLASVFAHIYIIAKVFRITNDKEFYTTLSKMIYGILCFCTLFATVGTILGGIWANYSWGRFWGWDPKENGALAIVLWNLIILHGRLGGIFKEFGIAIMSVFGGMVVVASWWGVNQLGVGLHSYGFTDGIVSNLIIFAVLELSCIAVGLFHHYVIERLKTTP